MYNADITKIFEIGEGEFGQMAMSLFRFQYEHNPLYAKYTHLTGKDKGVAILEELPFLPISFFKTHAVKTTQFVEEAVFRSSGTTGAKTSKHLVKEVSLYKTSGASAFERMYGPVEDYCILALLPSYLERGDSSLVYMVGDFMKRSKHPLNGFYLEDFDRLHQTLRTLEAQKQKTLLIGVTYALMDFAEAFPLALQHTLVMETGGMKGRKKELLRTEVHSRLQEAFGLPAIHSEYGMTELLSQAYAREAGRFITPPWMKILVGEEDDPGTLVSKTEKPVTGVLHIIDLANLYSCSFIATEDLGRLHPDGSFEVLGRMDHSDIRGCSLLTL
ncbi:MAG: acyl transferase [Flaviaesturariibacter sp.]|nr:acyl transferase [Flaviaesturariibacter sp.]